MKTRFAKTAKRIVRGLALILALAAMAIGLALSPPGQRRLARRAERAASQALGAEVQLRDAALRWPMELRIGRIRIASDDEVHAEARDLVLRVSARQLLRKRLWVHHARLSELTVRSWPAAPEPPAPRTGDIALPDPEFLLHRLVVSELLLERVAVGPPLAARPQTARIAGRWAPLDEDRAGNAFARRLDCRIETWPDDAVSDAAPDVLHVVGNLHMDGGELAGDLRMALADLAQVHGRIEGAATNPSIGVQVRATFPVPAHVAERVGSALSASVDFTLRDRRAHGRLTLESNGRRHAELEGEWPLDLSFAPARLRWPPAGPISGRWRTEADLAELAPIFLADEHRLSGRFTADLSVAGTVAQPEASGRIGIENGAYEHDRAGVILREMEAAFSGRRDRIALDFFRATDGGRGRLLWRGSVQVDPQADYPAETSLTLTDFRLFRNEFGQATGNGTIVWTGDRRASRLSGRLDVAPMELIIPERPPPFPAELDYVEMDGVAEEESAPSSRRRLWAEHDAQLDVEIAFRDRAHVRGRGLDSEWKGRLQLRGSAFAPELSGALHVVRGRWAFFGKRLAIMRGSIMLDGGRPPLPALDVLAETRAGGIRASLRVFGHLDAPQTRLESDLDLPEDEILARLLFGRETARVTPWQAVTLARAAHSLRGGGSAFDLMGQTRRLLRVDQIEVREAEAEDGAMVSVGRYIGDRVYLAVEHGIGTESGRARVEWELTPALRLETELGTDAEAGLDLGWRRDY